MTEVHNPQLSMRPTLLQSPCQPPLLICPHTLIRKSQTTLPYSQTPYPTPHPPARRSLCDPEARGEGFSFPLAILMTKEVEVRRYSGPFSFLSFFTH